MKSFIESVEEKIKNNFQIDKIEIKDNTDKHRTHKNFKKDKFHICLIIESRELKSLKPVRDGDSDLKTAMKMIAKTQKGPDEQIPSMGCNIKWFN